MPNEPTLYHQGESFKDSNKVAYIKAQNSLYNILAKFEHDHECDIRVDGKSLREWMETEVFNHRCHVQVRGVKG